MDNHRVGQVIHDGYAPGGLLISGKYQTKGMVLVMVSVDVSKLLESIGDAPPYTLPDMSAGTTYLYDTLYKRLSQGLPVRLSAIDFTAFEPEDITALNQLYQNVFDKNNYVSNSITFALRKATPVYRPMIYV